MESKHQEYETHRIEVREREGEPELLIDNVPIRYGQLPDGSYFLHKYAYDWSDNLMELAQRFIDHQIRVNNVRRKRETGNKEN